jgi:hypothetical protein
LVSRGRFATVAGVGILSSLCTTPPAHSYIDPNAAGLVSQLLTPLLVAAAAGLTFFRKRLADLFTGISPRFSHREDA